MAIASGSGRRVAAVVESVWGTTPSTPSFKTARVTGGSLRSNKSVGTSEEIRADRNVGDEFLLGMDAGGSYDFELTYGGLFDDLFESAMFGAWASNVLKNGITPKSLTFEETLELGATDQFYRFPGARVNTLSLNVAARAPVTGSVALFAQKETTGTSALSGATYAAPTTEPVSTASAHVASLAVAGLNPVPKIRSLGFELNNNLRRREVVGDLYSAEFGEGRCEITGSLLAYFENNDLYQKVLDHGSGALSFTVGNATTKKYTFLFPKIFFGDGEKQPGGNSDDVMVNIPWRAVYDATEACSLKITRAVA